MWPVLIVFPTIQIIVAPGSNLSHMDARKRENLTIVELPKGRRAVSAPPILGVACEFNVRR